MHKLFERITGQLVTAGIIAVITSFGLIGMMRAQLSALDDSMDSLELRMSASLKAQLVAFNDSIGSLELRMGDSIDDLSRTVERIQERLDYSTESVIESKVSISVVKAFLDRLNNNHELHRKKIEELEIAVREWYGKEPRNDPDGLD